MNIGPLNREIEFQYRSVTQDPVFNTDVVTWTAVDADQQFANIQDVMPSRSSAESIVNGATEVAVNRTRIRTRWRDDITSAHRIKITYPSVRYLQIVIGPSEIGGNMNFIEMMCEEITP
jgi:head-tail adaptor